MQCYAGLQISKVKKRAKLSNQSISLGIKKMLQNQWQLNEESCKRQNVILYRASPKWKLVKFSTLILELSEWHFTM